MKKENNKFLYLLAGILTGAIGVWILGYSNPNIFRFPTGTMKTENIVSQNSDAIDAHFIEQMIPHHEDAVTMSKIALEKSQREEVKELAENIISAQSKEINDMKSWYKEWFNRELPTGSEVMQHHGMMSGSSMHMGMMGNEMDIESLENSEDFDREFIEQMIPHHQMAVMMANMLKNSTEREEMKTLADNIINSQTSEIELMRAWLSDWNE